VKELTIFFILAGILTSSCIDQIDVIIDREEFILVVEGSISTEAGPHIIRLSRSAKYDADGITQVVNAEVSIRDQKGRVTLLTHAGFGVYKTPADFRAVVGNAYTLQITVLGKTYYSTPELVTKAPEIDSVILEYKEFPSLDPIEFDAGDFVSGVEAYSQWQDPENETNYYMWGSSGTYVVNTRPWDHFIVNEPDPTIIPDPLDCCATCWIDEPISDFSLRIMKDNNFNGIVTTQLVAFIEDDGVRYMDKYRITLKQFSISKEAYLFLDLLDNQLSINGDIFDPLLQQSGKYD